MVAVERATEGREVGSAAVIFALKTKQPTCVHFVRAKEDLRRALADRRKRGSKDIRRRSMEWRDVFRILLTAEAWRACPPRSLQKRRRFFS